MFGASRRLRYSSSTVRYLPKASRIPSSDPSTGACSSSLIFLTSAWSVKCDLAPLLGHPSRTLLLLYFHWFSNACSGYLHSDDGYRMVGILPLLINFYLITFGTYMDISPTVLSSLFARAWHPFDIYSYFLFDILLRGSVYYKNLHTTLE